MKKLFLLLLSLTIPQYALPYRYTLPIYPKKVSKLDVLVPIIGELGSFFLLVIGSTIEKNKLQTIERIFCLIPGLVGIIICSLALNNLYSLHKERHKPILIFDEEGFSYEKPIGLFKEKKPVRYLWKDVISHWSTGIVDGCDNYLQRTWCYHIKGIDEIVKINVSELEIPRKIQAKVESLRMGQIRALWSE
jgi:hypothetical protein